nr:unnamed protein product [Callosobruchus analis]
MNFKPPDQLTSSSEEKVATLLACIGDEGIHVYNSFTENEKSTLEKLVQAFDSYFLPKKVTAMESFKFNNMI